MLQYRHRGLQTGMVFFDEEPGPEKVDRLYFFHRFTPLENATCVPWRTLVLDLRTDPDGLLKNMEKTCVYKIRRAKERDNVVCEYPDPASAKVQAEFWDFFTQFASTTTVDMPDRQFVNLLTEQRRLVVSTAKDVQGETVAYHVYCQGQRRARLLYGCTLHRLEQDSGVRNAIGRANRLLFWTDILHFQEHELETFDFGGWYPGQSDTLRLGINKFKEGFGGQIVMTYVCDRGGTLKGKIALWIRDRVAALRGRKDE